LATQRRKRTPPIVRPEESRRLVEIADKATVDFRGNFDTLESAIGMLFIGRLVGWRILLLIHNKRTIKTYEEVLGINVREEFPEVGPFADKSLAYAAVQKLGNFWKAVSGEVPVPDRRELADPK